MTANGLIPLTLWGLSVKGTGSRRFLRDLSLHPGTERRRYRDAPVDIQQIVRNAIKHRIYEGTHAPVLIYWYSDRIEVISLGCPYGQVTRENFGHSGVHVTDNSLALGLGM